jgi:oligopeptide transport system substrate-binding protein
MRLPALLLILAVALVPGGCRQKPVGTVKAIVIGSEPRLVDPAEGQLGPGDEVLLANVAQGLVRFDAAGNIVPGIAERWNVSDDGLSYIFRIAETQWPDKKKVTAPQVAKLLKREISASSNNPLKDTLGAVGDIVAMTDRVIEIQLRAPRPNLLNLLAQPEFAVLRGGYGSGPFAIAAKRGPAGELSLEREVIGADGEQNSREQVLLAGGAPQAAIDAFVAAKADLVLGGTYLDLPLARRAKLPRNSLVFDPASGLFGLVPTHSGGPLDKPEVRQLLSQAIDRGAIASAAGAPGLALRATVLEPGLENMPAPAVPPWMGVGLDQRRAGLTAAANKLLGPKDKPAIRVALPPGAGSDLLFAELGRDWGAIGLKVERASNAASADFVLIDAVAPSTSAAWFLRHFRCEAVPVCDPEADKLLDAARETVIPAQRAALLAEAATRIDAAELFLPIAAPVRWSLVSGRIQGFVGNRYARHTLTDLEQRPGSRDS